MEKKNLAEQTTTSDEITSVVPDPKDQQLTELKQELLLLIKLVQGKSEQISDPRDQQIANIKEEMSFLTNLIQTKQAQSTRNVIYENAMDEIRELKSLVKNYMLTSMNITKPAQENQSCCNDQPCNCISEKCCCFEIIMDYVRVLAMQPLELDDSNANPWGELEVRLFAYIDGGTGAVIPSMFSTLTLTKLIQHPGLKVSINRTIGTVCFPKGKTKLINIGCDAVEIDAGLIERATGGRDEEGSNSTTMNLDCCCNTPIKAAFDINFTSGGQGGGAIEVGFSAIKKC